MTGLIHERQEATGRSDSSGSKSSVAGQRCKFASESKGAVSFEVLTSAATAAGQPRRGSQHRQTAMLALGAASPPAGVEGTDIIHTQSHASTIAISTDAHTFPVLLKFTLRASEHTWQLTYHGS